MQTYKRLSTSHRGLFTSLVEVWKDIDGYEGIYQISSFGRVKSLARMRTGRGGCLSPLRERIMSLKTNKHGYLCIGLHQQGKKFFSIHQLVARAFIQNPDAKGTVNHIDCNKKNNNVNNLEWSTHKEQMQHAVANNLLEIRGKPKFTKADKLAVYNYSKDNPELSLKDLSNLFGMSERTVGRIINEGVSPRVTTCTTKHSGVITKKVPSNADVLEIKRLRSLGHTLSYIGALFDLGTSQVWRICNNLSRNNNYEQ